LICINGLMKPKKGSAKGMGGAVIATITAGGGF
jgi:hypothetical protein